MITTIATYRNTLIGKNLRIAWNNDTIGYGHCWTRNDWKSKHQFWLISWLIFMFRVGTRAERVSLLIHTSFCVVYQCKSTSVLTLNLKKISIDRQWILMSSDTLAVDRTISNRWFIVIDQWLNELVTDIFLRTSKKDKDTQKIWWKTFNIIGN